MSSDVLSAAAGHPVRTPLALLQGRTLRDRCDKEMLFLVEEGACRPFAIVKWATEPAVKNLRVEQEALRRMRSSGDTVIARSCPAIWGPFPAGEESAVTLQRCLPGPSAYAQLRTSPWPRLLARGHFDRVADWLERFWAVAGQPAHPFNEKDIREHIEGPLLAARERLGSEIVPESALRATLAASRACIGQPVRLVARHGDLWASNLLMGRRWLYVVDWEEFRPESFPTFDMLLFCTTYAMDFPWRPFGWADHREAFERAYLQPTWLGRHIERFLERGCQASGFNPSLLPIMLPVTLAEMALRREPNMGPGQEAHRSSWSDMLQAWWNRPTGNWLEAWAGSRARDHGSGDGIRRNTS
jgi:hypothetical protein